MAKKESYNNSTGRVGGGGGEKMVKIHVEEPRKLITSLIVTKMDTNMDPFFAAILIQKIMSQIMRLIKK